ncbi:Pre-mRNA-splicing factor of RES complex-domain-containing protein [Lipomyces arxii]|uniref:Pre-mRNA-splicing factor of RES complex-domain-containing protein n=1 Tax=Lipomyces arxii TaxID=56418 RepID=UPI0034CFF626
MSRLDYLASKYLTADSESNDLQKKRKRKDKHGSHKHKHSKKTFKTEDGLILADDDAAAWGLTGGDRDDEDGQLEAGEDAPVTVDVPMAKESKKSAGWRKVGATQVAYDGDDDDDEIIVKQEDKPNQEPDERPARVGGLKTAAQVKARLDAKMAEEMEKMEKSGTSGKNAETVYRDASGRRIDINAYKAKMAQQLIDEERKKVEAAEKEIELNKGLVQEIQKKEEAERLDNAKSVSLNRYANDQDLNSELKDQDLWADPAAKFLKKKKEVKTSATGLKLYQGAYPANRYNIAPGHRWDGVDRSNGFEVKLLAKRQEKVEKKREEDAYGSDYSDD